MAGKPLGLNIAIDADRLTVCCGAVTKHFEALTARFGQGFEQAEQQDESALAY